MLADNYRALGEAVAHDYHITVDAALTAYDLREPSGYPPIYHDITSLQAAYEMRKYLRTGVSLKEVAFKFGCKPKDVTDTLAKHNKQPTKPWRCITNELVAEIYEVRQRGGESLKVLSTRYGVSKAHLGRLLKAHEEGL